MSDNNTRRNFGNLSAAFNAGFQAGVRSQSHATRDVDVPLPEVRDTARAEFLDTAPFVVGMDLFPVFENRKFKKSDFVIGRRFYVWHESYGRIEILIHIWGGVYYIEQVIPCESSCGAFTKEHVYCTPFLDRALAAAEFCTTCW